MSTPTYSIHETMPYFVGALRAVDEWKRQQSRRAHIIEGLDQEAKQKYQKCAFAKSSRVDELIRFVEDTALDINFMVQLPSVEKCLIEWWELFVKDSKIMNQEQLRSVYYDLSYCLVEARTETIQKNAVAMLMRGPWTLWDPDEASLTQQEFCRIMFILGHLMTTTRKLADYVIFFQETLSKLTRLHQIKAKRLEQAQERKRIQKIKRKTSVISTLRHSHDSAGSALMFFSTLTSSIKETAAVVTTATAVVARKKNNTMLQEEENPFGEIPDRFVEVLDRTKNNSQCLEHDPLLNDPRFQNKWKSSSNSNIASVSLEKRTIESNPETNRYFPPLYVSRIKTSSHGISSSSSLKLRATSSSTPNLHSTSRTKPTTMTESTFKIPKSISSSSSSSSSIFQPRSTLALDSREEDIVASSCSSTEGKKSPSTKQLMVEAQAGEEEEEEEEEEDEIVHELLRRSLAGAVLKKRIKEKKKNPMPSPNRFPMNPKEIEEKQQYQDTQEKKIYLAIST